MTKRKEEKTFDRRIINFTTSALILSTTIIILVSVISTVTSVMNKSTQMAMREVEVMAINTEDDFQRYYEMVWSIMLDENIQRYLKEAPNQYEYVPDANRVLDNACNVQTNINFISIMREDGEGSLTKGYNIPHWKVNYQEELLMDYQNSMVMGNNSMRMLFSNEYHPQGAYTMNIYYPLFSATKIGERLGLICININDSNITPLTLQATQGEELPVETYFVHSDGTIVSCANVIEIHTQFKGQEFIDGGQRIRRNGSYVEIDKKLLGWDFSYITRISTWELLRDSLWSVVILVLLLIGFILVIMQLVKRMVTKAYAPWGGVVKAMDEVSRGELETRLKTHGVDSDMQVVSRGFNGMMEQMIKLMQEIKEEQYQVDQIRLEALHSQIQPHFLYNTLDCIHWQAVIDGNKDISDLIKALASYYRLCLSKGRDIITIEEELICIEKYLYIQQFRYGDILNYEICKAAIKWEQITIPKLTLQPLVENAIYHGIKLLGNKEGIIRITLCEKDEEMKIEIADNGVGMSERKIEEINQLIQSYDEQFGYGVRNVNRRLQLYYGPEYGLTYKKNEQGGITVEVLLPNVREIKESEMVL
jgi:Predicted signal transduction protein with a C-terminal ATPase domain